MNPAALWLQDLLSAGGAPLLSAFLLGLLVALSPCPLSTNLAALAYVGRQATEPGQVLYLGALYTGGRVISYSALTALLVLVGLEVSRVATLLQDAGQYLLGPLLIVVGLVALGLLPLRLPSALGARVGWGRRLAEAGPAGAFGLGALFALAFCPYSATVYFGALLPLALAPAGGPLLAPAFAVGTSLPVLVAASLLSAGVAGLTRWLEATARLELWLRRLTGLLFLIAGLYAMSAWFARWG